MQLLRMMAAAGLALMLGLGAALAQQAWVQVEAQPGVQRAQESASGYARRLQNVNGFRLGATNWYAIALGPFEPGEADLVRRRLRQTGQIPGDAFVTDGTSFRSRFWPIGGGAITPVTPDPPAETALAPEAPTPVPLDETPQEARQSEALLTAQERRQLQTALEWAGFYRASIDGAFGRGTRAAMADWQEANGAARTGILTTAQRAALLRDYNSILDGLGLERVREDVAGIEIVMPTALVGFDEYEPPFAHYGPNRADDLHKVLLISQRGNQATLFGLYDIMQTLEIVPENGARERGETAFTLTGEGRRFISHTEASLENGQVKGFTLIWPVGDEERRLRLLQEMRASFTRLPGIVMDDLVGEPDEDQRIDLLAGLQIRRPERQVSGFFVDPQGAVLTTADAVGQCGRITLNENVEAELAQVDDASGLALLRPKDALAPRAFARFQSQVPRLKSDVVLAGYSFEGALGAPSLTYGSLADLRGLNGEEAIKRFDLAAQPGDAGGPVFDLGGAVLGMLIPRDVKDGRVLPDAATFAVDVEVIAEFLNDAGLVPAAEDKAGRLPVTELTRRAKDMTVLVGCWSADE